MESSAAKLPRLDTPARSGWWRFLHRAMDPADRRVAFQKLMIASGLDVSERMAKMRTLIDLGLWSDINPPPVTWPGRVLSFFAPLSLHKLVIGYEEKERSFLAHALPALLHEGVPPELLHLALESGIDVNEEMVTDTPLSIVIREGLPEHAKVLIEAGATVAATQRQSPLVLAIEQYKRAGSRNAAVDKLIELLLESGADPNEMTSYMGVSGDLPLWVAASTFHPPIVDRLLEAGAKTIPEDHPGKDIINYTLSHSMTAQWTSEMEQSFRSIVSSLKLYGLDIDRGSPLVSAISRRFYLAADALVDMGADLRQRNEDGMGIAHAVVLNLSPSDSLVERILPQIPEEAWSWTDSQGRSVLDTLEIRAQENIDYNVEDSSVEEWQSFFSAKDMRLATPQVEVKPSRIRL